MNKYITMLAQQSWPKVVVMGIVALGAYYMMMFDDGHFLQMSIDKSQTTLTDAQKSLKMTKDAIANADKFEREVKEAVDNFNRVVDFMPERFSIAELTSITTDLSTRAGAKLLKTEPRDGKPGFNSGPKASFYDTSRLGFQLEGTFSQVLMFLSYLSRVPKLMTFEKVELNATGSGDSDSPRLRLEATLVGYRYIKPKPVEADATKPAGAAK